MARDISQRFRDHVVVGDGAMGSELLTVVDSVSELDLAAIEHPKEVLEVHLRYLKAGAEIIETATFAASRPRLQRHQAGDLVERVNSEAVKIAREARDIAGNDCLIAGSIGPLAGVIDLDDVGGPEGIAAAHAEQAAVLAGRGADLLVLETFFRRDEFILAVEAARSVCDLPIIGLLTFAAERPPHQYDEQARKVAEIAELGLCAVGINCSPGPMGALEILRGVRSIECPLAAMPNSGVLQRREERILMPPATPEYMARFARQAAELGVSLIGGCCGTGPEHIEAIAEAVRGITPVAHRGPAVVTVEAPGGKVEARRPESPLAEKIDSGTFVRLVQLDPPKGTNAERVCEAAEELAQRGLVDAVDINSNPLARLRMDSLWLAEEVQRRTGLECVPHITPRDASLMGLQAQLLGAWLKGIRNLLAISGDPSQLGDYPGVHDVYHVNIFELVRALSRMAEGFDCAGNPIGEPPSFLIGVAVNPNADDLDHEIERLRRKVDAGAHFAMTQVFFGWEPWERFLDRCGGSSPIPTLVPVWPLRSLKLALRLHHEVPGIVVPDELLSKLEAAGPDAAKVGYERAVAMLRGAEERAAGAYIIAPFKQPEQIVPLIDDAMG
jgi:homocysteine S-methyltransferase